MILLSTRDGIPFYQFGEAPPPDDDPRRGAFVLERVPGELFPVDMRRVNYIEGIAFSSQGELFFGSRGDLWQGSIGSVDATRELTGGHDEYASLFAKRCAALADLETSRTSSTQVGVQKVAPADGRIYVHLLRMYGTGFGFIASLPTPPPPDEEMDGLDARIKLYAKEASALQIIGICQSRSYLCASSDGKRVFFRGELDRGANTYRFYLIENHDKPRELKIIPPGTVQPSPTPTPARKTQAFEKELDQQIKDLFPGATPGPTQKQ
jgi:hypothetical protein